MIVKVEFEVALANISEPYSEQDIKDYLRYVFKDNGIISVKNPFAKFYDDKPEPTPMFNSFKIQKL